ncbi:cellulose synthase/poly-beta-1,6-N-acetylglucosamine synthase-like glycosyltransferase [Silicimonas algicola]|uniref:Cellulose synthase/poly-beta-1,6-N-acetylglucosamine synthase-like glycosyltransferase n=1 Tax=Silicimonas algicola TaxID=1826607 RepID=A0A316GPJ9_9RHOB|nr:cellulose synthase/poly-beta-1,6-N-acetylglucosamine synthase-like glycosyltransferase [Silicimonas algicola]
MNGASVGSRSPASGRSRDLTLDVVVPAHEAETTIGACLDALVAAGFPPERIVVVDDGSADRTGDIAKSRGTQVLRNDTPARPANARNQGAAAASGDGILFVDADVLVHCDVRARILHCLGDPSIDGVIGAYDDAPGSETVVGRYRNLLHCHTHRQAAGQVPTFWTGLGAIRKAAFDHAGGFLKEWENIEDVEFGLKVTAEGGTIVLDPGIMGKHLKDWTLFTMFRTDMNGRAVPWTKLLISGRMPRGVLSTTWDKRVSAAAVALAVLSLPLALVWPAALLLTAICGAVFTAANADLIRFLATQGGRSFAVQAVILHALHHLAAVLGYLKARLRIG